MRFEKEPPGIINEDRISLSSTLFSNQQDVEIFVEPAVGDPARAWP